MGRGASLLAPGHGKMRLLEISNIRHVCFISLTRQDSVSN